MPAGRCGSELGCERERTKSEAARPRTKTRLQAWPLKRRGVWKRRDERTSITEPAEAGELRDRRHQPEQHRGKRKRLTPKLSRAEGVGLND